MLAPRYLYLTRDGHQASYHVAIDPTPTDRLRVRMGLLEIVRLEDLARFHPQRGWQPLDAGILSDFSDTVTEPAFTHVLPERSKTLKRQNSRPVGCVQDGRV